MAHRDAIVDFLNRRLLTQKITDSGMNGLQFEGAEEVRRVALAVDSGYSVIEKAIRAESDFLLVHHGLLWEKALPVTGPFRKIVGSIIAHDLNLYAVHLPLDADSEWGNNFELARLLSLTNLRSAIPYKGTSIGCLGENTQSKTLGDFREILLELPGGYHPLVLEFGLEVPKRVCVVTGSGADALHCAQTEGFDTLITGEPRQFAYHFAKERNLNVIFAGHYATETVGVQAVGKALKKEFQVETIFIDEPTGI